MEILEKIRRAATKNIKRAVKDYLHGSGYVDQSSPDGSVQLVVLKRERKLRQVFSTSVKDGVIGFTSYGVITDAFAGGLATVEYGQIALEDLLKLEKVATKLIATDFK